MTQQSVEILIGKLLTDEELREAFEQNPHAVLVWLLRQGLQLSRLEMEALTSIKPSDLSGLADLIDRRLQKASLRRAYMTHTVHDTDTLPTAPLGTTGMRITRVGFGAWAIGGGGWSFAWGSQDDADSIGAIRHAVERGINWIDTAAVYGLGHSEEIVARAPRDIPADDRPYVFTKAGLVWDVHDHAAPLRRVGDHLSLRREVEASLRRLGVERIDLYQMHWPAEDGTPLEDYWGTLLQLKEEGKVRAVGLSNHDVAQLEAAERLGHVDTLQPPFSAIRREIAAAELPWCAAHGTGVIVYSPVQSGLLTGTFSAKRAAQLDAGDWRSRSPDFTGEIGRAGTPVTRIQLGSAFGAERAREESRLHRTVYDDPGAVRGTPRELRSRDLPADRGKRRLQRVHVSEPLRRFELRDVVIGEPDGADLPFLLQLQECAPVVFERSAVLGGPVHLVQVDALDAEPAERGLDLAAKAQGIPHAAQRGGMVVLVPDQAGFGEDVWPVVGRDIAQRAGDDLLRVAEAVHRRRIDPVDAALDGVTDGGDRVRIILVAPGEGPAAAADRPRAEADARDPHAGGAERRRGKRVRVANCVCHRCPPQRRLLQASVDHVSETAQVRRLDGLERLDLESAQLETLPQQPHQHSVRILLKRLSQLLVGDELADQDLHALMRHRSARLLRQCDLA